MDWPGRERIKRQLDNGERASGYRSDYLRLASKRIMKVLHELSIEFDSVYTHDRFSALDLIDVLATTKAKIEDNLSDAEKER